MTFYFGFGFNYCLFLDSSVFAIYTSKMHQHNVSGKKIGIQISTF